MDDDSEKSGNIRKDLVFCVKNEKYSAGRACVCVCAYGCRARLDTRWLSYFFFPDEGERASTPRLNLHPTASTYKGASWTHYYYLCFSHINIKNKLTSNMLCKYMSLLVCAVGAVSRILSLAGKSLAFFFSEHRTQCLGCGRIHNFSLFKTFEAKSSLRRKEI